MVRSPFSFTKKVFFLKKNFVYREAGSINVLYNLSQDSNSFLKGHSEQVQPFGVDFSL